MSGRLLIYGASAHGRVVADAALGAGWEIVGWADGDPARLGTEVVGAKVLAAGEGSCHAAAGVAQSEGAEIVVAIGDNRNRRDVLAALMSAGGVIATVVHPRAVVSPRARLARGTVVFAGAVVNPGAVVGEGVIVNTGVVVDHDCVLGDHVHLSPGVHLGGEVRIGEGSHLGVGVSVRNGIEIGAWSLVGVGAAVVEPIPSGVVAYGVPARVMRTISR